ncbi:MAG: undecaprenyl-diphosphatase UppP [Parcubacteria group bacterium]|nr:undecaprenyl-diphosphatase UppP [Parcubacteria group bacterium]
MPHAFSSIILGIVEGFTEFLPISSTAHLTLAADLLRLPQSDYMKTFEIVIQSGAILAVIALYWKKFLNLEILKRIIIAFIPTGIVGLIFYKLVKTYLIGNISVSLSALVIGGLFLILFEQFYKEKLGEQDVLAISYKKAFWIGLCQSIAIIPGVSRAAATIIGGMFLGIKRKTIVEFSFLLAVPTMIAATGLDLFKNFNSFSSSQANLLTIGFITSFLMALVSIKFLLSYIKNHTFTNFGIYRIILVIVFVLFFLV